jgi:hypothetical protein
MTNRLSGLFICFLAIACASPGDSPGSVTVFLTSAVDKRPYSAKELAIPAIQEIIEACKKKGLSDCETNDEPVDNRSEFDRAIHGKVMTVVKLSALQANRLYKVDWKLFDPNGQLVSRYSLSLPTSEGWDPSYSLNYQINWTPPDQASWQLGRWRIDIFVNGQLETQRSFNVFERKQVSRLLDSNVCPGCELSGASFLAERSFRGKFGSALLKEAYFVNSDLRGGDFRDADLRIPPFSP